MAEPWAHGEPKVHLAEGLCTGGRWGCSTGRRAAPLQAGQPQRARGSRYSQASLLSKLDRAMAKACSAHNG